MFYIIIPPFFQIENSRFINVLELSTYVEMVPTILLSGLLIYISVIFFPSQVIAIEQHTRNPRKKLKYYARPSDL